MYQKHFLCAMILHGYVTALVKISNQVGIVRHKFKKSDFLIRFNDVTDKDHPVNLYDDGNPYPERVSFDWRLQKKLQVMSWRCI